MRSLLAWLLVAAACAPSPARPTPAAKPGALVMIVGCYHFDNPGLDAVKVELDDHLRPERQAQIAAVVEKLAAFRPTRILVEAVDQARLDERYRSGGPLAAGEGEQLGFRLARRLGLPGVVAIDTRLDMDFDRLLAAGKASGDQVFLAEFQAAMAHAEAEGATLSRRTVLESLRRLNDPARLARDRELYLQIARVKHGDDFAGADVLAAWYQRNFRIFANLAAAVTSPDDRVLVLYGAGHLPILRELVAASTQMVLVEPNAYLR